MLKIVVPETEFFDDDKQRFYTSPHTVLTLEHSLVSLSKWEMKWHKPFLSKLKHSPEEMLDYIRFMTITQNVPDIVYHAMSQDILDTISDYIGDPMSAITPRIDRSKPNNEVVTYELIYYWMVAHGIDFECQKWHLNKLLSVIRVCNAKAANAQSSGKTKRPKDYFSRQRATNAARRAKYNSKG